MLLNMEFYFCFTMNFCGFILRFLRFKGIIFIHFSFTFFANWCGASR